MTQGQRRQPGFGCSGCAAVVIAVFFLFIGIPVIGMVGVSTFSLPRTAVASPPLHTPSPLLPPFDGRYIWPVEGPIASPFGWRLRPDDEADKVGEFHTGIDIAVVTGTPVKAPASGTVTFAGWSGGYGNLMKLRHRDSGGNVFETWYGHLSAFRMSVGQEFQVGDVVALSGSTGRSTGPHVHFEYRVDDVPIDPNRLYRR